MVATFKKRWIRIAAIWAVVFSLNLWNLNKIDFIGKTREKQEVLRMDERFWHQNTATISHILKKRAVLVQDIESLKLGLFELQTELETLALQLGLNSFSITSQPQSDDRPAGPIKISFQSTFRRANRWFDRLQDDLPHVQIKNVKITLDPSSRQAAFEVGINWRYNLLPAGLST